MQVRADIESGNIEVAAIDAGGTARLTIRPDPGPDGFFQWFCFRVVGAAGRPVCLRIENAGRATYPKGWEDYRAVAGSGRGAWRRVETSYRDGVLEIRDRPESDSETYAYFAPYGAARRHALVADVLASGLARLDVLGDSLDGEGIDCLRLGPDGAGARAWLIARQHPGETQASWWMEGFLRRLTDPADALARRLLADTRFYVVPNMNPDGSRRGYLRTNAAGANLNREWADPSAERSPEVACVRAAMDETGVDFFLDVHGDEALPYCFIAGSDSVPSATGRTIALREAYEAALRAASPDFQSEVGYPKAPPGKANLAMAAPWVAERFGCLAMTLEMPFKDNAAMPDAARGWSPERAAKLGAACLDALAAVRPDLR